MGPNVWKKGKSVTRNKDELDSSSKAPNKNLWLKQRTVMQENLATIFDKPIEENQILEWLMPGVKIGIIKKKTLKKERIIDLSPVFLQYTNPLLSYFLTYSTEQSPS
jgi:hypothetical protein